MDHKDNHLVKSLEIARVSVPLRHRTEVRDRVGDSRRQLEVEACNYQRYNYANFSDLLTDITHLEFFDALDFIWIVGHDGVDPLAIAVAKHLLSDICTWLRRWRR